MSSPRKSVSYRIDQNIDERMGHYVAEHGGSKTALVERAVMKYMDERERESALDMFELSVDALGADTVKLLLREAVIHKRG